MKKDFEGLKKNWGLMEKKVIKNKNNHFTMLWGGLGFDKQRSIIWSFFSIGKKRRFDEPGKQVAKKIS